MYFSQKLVDKSIIAAHPRHQSWHKPPTTVLSAYTARPVPTQATDHSTTSTNWRTSPDTNRWPHYQLLSAYTDCQPLSHWQTTPGKQPSSVLPSYTDRPVLTQTTDHSTISIHWQTSPDTNHQTKDLESNWNKRIGVQSKQKLTFFVHPWQAASGQ